MVFNPESPEFKLGKKIGHMFMVYLGVKLIVKGTKIIIKSGRIILETPTPMK